MPQPLECRLLLVQPSRLSREGLRAILRDVASSVIDAGSAEVFTKSDRPARPDVVIWGSGIPRKALAREIAAIRNIFDPSPEPIKHIVLANDIGPAIMRQVVALDVDALLHDDITGAVLLRYVDLVLLGQRLFPVLRREQVLTHAEIVQFPGAQHRPPPTLLRPHDVTLTPREAEILHYLAKGASNKSIAAALNSAEGAVKGHVRSLLRKIRVANRTQAAAWALNHQPNIVAKRFSEEGQAIPDERRPA